MKRHKREILELTCTGIPIEQIELTPHVGYGDLKLATAAGASELEKRVKDTAAEARKQLATLYPVAMWIRTINPV